MCERVCVSYGFLIYMCKSVCVRMCVCVCVRMSVCACVSYEFLIYIIYVQLCVCVCVCVVRVSDIYVCKSVFFACNTYMCVYISTHIHNTCIHI